MSALVRWATDEPAKVQKRKAIHGFGVFFMAVTFAVTPTLV